MDLRFFKLYVVNSFRKMGMGKKAEPIRDQQSPEETLRKLGVFRTADAIDAGVSQPTVSRLAMRGILIRLDHGLYHHRDTEIDLAAIDFITACARTGPDSVVGGLSALFHYGLIPQVPQQIWVLLPHTNRNKFPQYRIMRTNHDPKVGVNNEGTYRIVTIERSIVEAFKYASKLGYQTALTAARTALSEGKTSEEKMYETAKDLGLWPVMVRNWEAITTK
jgi:predicted transcriptional regulator of viral defense system